MKGKKKMQNESKFEKVMRALACCSGENGASCADCPFSTLSMAECTRVLTSAALAIIKRQTGEIETLKLGNKSLIKLNCERQKALLTECHARTIDEFAERVKQSGKERDDAVIDAIAEALRGETK